MTHATITYKLGEVNEAMRRPGLLQRADDVVPHTVARVLLAIAGTVEEDPDGLRWVDSMQSQSDRARMGVPARGTHALPRACRHAQSAGCLGMYGQSPPGISDIAHA